MRVVFVGPPGAGKGTQAARMAERFSVRHASTGDIFRRAAAQGSELGRTVKQYLDSGTLVPDELTSRVVEEMVVACEQSYILDGYPRTLQQGQDLEAMLDERGQSLDAVLYFDVPDDVAVERLTGRLVCSRCGANYHRTFMPPRRDGLCDGCDGPLSVRSDSSEEVVRERLAQYREKTLPLVQFYEDKGLLARIDASTPPDEVARRTETVLSETAFAGPDRENPSGRD